MTDPVGWRYKPLSTNDDFWGGVSGTIRDWSSILAQNTGQTQYRISKDVSLIYASGNSGSGAICGGNGGWDTTVFYCNFESDGIFESIVGRGGWSSLDRSTTTGFVGASSILCKQHWSRVLYISLPTIFVPGAISSESDISSWTIVLATDLIWTTRRTLNYDNVGNLPDRTAPPSACSKMLNMTIEAIIWVEITRF